MDLPVDQGSNTGILWAKSSLHVCFFFLGLLSVFEKFEPVDII